MRLEVDVEGVQSSDHVPSHADIYDWIQAGLSASGRALNKHDSIEVAVRIVDDLEMTRLNTDWRGKSSSTNVLSFPAMTEVGDGLCHLGDIAICASVVAAEAAAQGKPQRSHWAHLLVHGTLHLLGYDHETDSDAELMEQTEIHILSSLNIPNPYEIAPAREVNSSQ